MALSFTTGLVNKIWRFHNGDPAQSLTGNPSPTHSKLLQAEDTRDQGSVLSITHFLDTQVTSAQNLRFTLHSPVATRDNGGHTEFWGSYKGGDASQAHTEVTQPGLQRQNSVGLEAYMGKMTSFYFL